MTKEELIRDLCSVEFRSKSKTRELIEEFIAQSLVETANLIKGTGGQHITNLRQWLNEERITDSNKMVSNEDILYWLDGYKKELAKKFRKEFEPEIKDHMTCGNEQCFHDGWCYHLTDIEFEKIVKFLEDM